MYNKKRTAIYGLVLLIGIAVLVCAALGIIEDSWGCFGGGIIGVMAVRLYMGVRYGRDAEFAKQTDIAYKDERTIYLSNKAKSWAYYLTVVGLAAACVIFRVIRQPVYSNVCAYTVCGMSLLYWAAYMILSRKY